MVCFILSAIFFRAGHPDEAEVGGSGTNLDQLEAMKKESETPIPYDYFAQQ